MLGKRRSLMLSVIFLFSLLMGWAGIAHGATTYATIGAQTWGSSAKGAEFKFRVSIDPCDAGQHGAIFKFNNNIYVQKIETTGHVGGIENLQYGFKLGDSQFSVNFTNKVALKKVEFWATVTADLNNYYGDINLEVERVSGDFKDGTIKGLGKSGDGSINVSVGKKPVMSDVGIEVGPIYMKENIRNSVLGKKEALKIKLPKGFAWKTGTVVIEDITTSTKQLPYALEGDGRVLVIPGDRGVLNVTGEASHLKITGFVDVTDKTVAFGDVKADFSSDVDLNITSLVLAQYLGYASTVRAAKGDVQVLAGRINQDISDIVIKEDAPGSLQGGNTIILTLPAEARWFFLDSRGQLIDKGDVPLKVNAAGGDPVAIESKSLMDSSTLKLVLGSNVKTKNAATLRLEDLSVILAGDAAGDLVIKVEGNAGVQGDVAVAKIVPPIAVQAESRNIKIGMQDQAAGNITIIEPFRGAVMGKFNVYYKSKYADAGTELVVYLPEGVLWASVPKVAVTQGDLELGQVSVDLNQGHILVLPVKESSDAASTITISDVRLTTSRDLAQGQVQAKVGGSAVNESYDAGYFSTQTVASVTNAYSSTLAPDESQTAVVFTLGSSQYLVNGVGQTMDVAAFAANNRTYLPIRYAALALGVPEDEILWDGQDGKVTLIKGDKVVQVQVGSREMLVNNAPVPMDVSPLAQDGRTFLPFRWLATAFGAQVDYDADSQKVTMQLQDAQRN